MEEERKRHDKAIERLEAAQTEWNQKRLQRIDFINDELRKQNHALKTFNDVDEAIREYNALTDSNKLDTIGPKPTLSEFYTPSDNQKSREITFIALGLITTALVSFEIAKRT